MLLGGRRRAGFHTVCLHNSDAPPLHYTGKPTSTHTNRRSVPDAPSQHFGNLNRSLGLDSGDSPIYDQDPFAPLASLGTVLIIFVGSTTQKGGQSGMTACSADSVIIGAYACAALAHNRPPEKVPSQVRLRWMRVPFPILSNAPGAPSVPLLSPRHAHPAVSFERLFFPLPVHLTTL